MATDILLCFRNSGVPTTGLSPTIDVWEVATKTQVATTEAMEEIGGGYYKYNLEYDSLKKYVYIADGTATITAAAERYLAGDLSYHDDQ